MLSAFIKSAKVEEESPDGRISIFHVCAWERRDKNRDRCCEGVSVVAEPRVLCRRQHVHVKEVGL